WRFLHQAERQGVLFICLAVVGAVVGMIAPRALRPVFVGWMIAVFPIGWLVSHALLAVVFYGVFTPLSLAFRALGRDALRRQRSNDASYWLSKRAAADVAGYY